MVIMLTIVKFAKKGTNHEKTLYQITTKCFGYCFETVHLWFWLNEKNKNKRLAQVLRRDRYEAIHQWIFTEWIG